MKKILNFRKILPMLIAVGLFVACSEKEIQRPNIVWIIAEDLSQDLGCYGNSLVLTPTLDKLAKDGMRFSNVFTTAPACTPSRTALAVGMYQTSINAHHMRYPEELRNPLPEGVLPINEIFRRNGYQTANIKDKPGRGKTDWSFKSDLAPYDFSSWNELNPEAPFFAVVNLGYTHRAFGRDKANPVDPEKVEVPPYYPDHVVTRMDFAQYLESIQLLDKQVKMVMDEIDKRNWADNTIVMFFSDHGRPFTRGKNFLYDTGTKIPLIIKAPQQLYISEYLPAGGKNSALISAIDISATSMALAGIDMPEYLQGKVILGPEKESDRKFVISTADRMGEIFSKSRSVRDKQFKYIRNFNNQLSINDATTAYRRAMHPIYQLLVIMDEKDQLDSIQKQLVVPPPEEELYDLQSDPWEIHNLAKDPTHQEVLEKMRKRLADWQEETVDYGMNADSPELEQAFVDYGIQSAKNYAAKGAKLREEVVAEIE